MFVFDVWVTLPLIAAAVPQAIFVVVFALPCLGAGVWWRDPVGRALFFKSLTLGALLVTVAARVVYHMATADHLVVDTSLPTSGIDRFGALLYWLVFAAILYQLVVLVRQRFIARRKP